MKICVFCSSSNAVDDVYFDAATELGNLIGQQNHSLVYGGANVGLMEQVASTVKNARAKIIGVIPQKIHERNLSSNHPDELIITETMNERKRTMHHISDAFIALPGGFGTLEEILEVITLKQLDYHQKPIVFINTNGFYNQLFKQFEVSYAEGFAKDNYRRLFQVVETAWEAINYIEQYKHEDLGTKWFNVPGKL
jgi:cytokinin riboside 5'-monophosphate phosphoribohydrolase